MPAVIRNLEARFGGGFRAIEDVQNVTTTPVQVLGHDMERASVLFCNLGTAEVYLNIHANVSTTRGIRLGPLGGTVAMDVYEDNIFPAWEWWAVASAGTNALLILTSKRETWR